MPYTLDSIVKFKKYEGKTIQQCIDENTYAWNNIILKNPHWYSSEVLNYLFESIEKINSYKSKSFISLKNRNKWMERKNT